MGLPAKVAVPLESRPNMLVLILAGGPKAAPSHTTPNLSKQFEITRPFVAF
jgi:hypothetical protein